jgi:N-acetylglucosaminyldiphosphoundecaprenol N-acetyl-beta-D-mannosaminyltransferase
MNQIHRVSNQIHRVSIMGLPIDALTHEQAVDRITAAMALGHGGWVITPNLDIVRQAHRTSANRALFAAADLILADGMPLVWASRLQGTPLPERVPGSDLVWSLPERAARLGAPVFLLGGAPGTAERAADRLMERFPDLKIAGTLSPPMGFERDPAEVEAVLTTVRLADPRVVLVGLGFPKQEQLIRRLRPVCPHAWFLGVGISLAFLSHDVRRAPRWLQAVGLEWVHRLSQEPARLARRYLIDDLPFGLRLFVHAARTRWRTSRPTAG